MTVVKSFKGRRTNKNGFHNGNNDNHSSMMSRLLFYIVCLWPLLYILFTSFISNNNNPTDVTNEQNQHRSISEKTTNIALQFRDILDRVDIMGYGPTHPRVAVVIVGNDKDDILLSVESVFTNTDMNRIFLAVVIVDGMDEDIEFTNTLTKFDTGSAPHWHETKPDIHVHEPNDKKNKNNNDAPHGRKVHVSYNPNKRGLAECRKDAIDFIRILEEKHIEAGLKSSAEDLILLLLSSGAQFTSRNWLPAVTEALIVPPPILGKDDNTIALKLANAISFNLNGAGRRDSFDVTFTAIITEPSAEQLALSNGESYPTPALNGAAIAMRLDTYLNLPSQDLSLKNEYYVNLDLALNLWLCADGIDMLRDLDITLFGDSTHRKAAPLPPNVAARFSVAWMDDATQKKYYNAYTKSFPHVTYLEWETYVNAAIAEPHFSHDLPQKCRSFQWYLEEINTDWSDFLSTPAVLKPEKDDEDGDNKKEKADSNEEAKEEEKTDDAPEFLKPQKMERKKPQEPLCDECLKIVEQAKPYDITFVDVSAGHKDHPHMGALDTDGNPGYVHDETSLRLHPPKNSFTTDMLVPLCNKRDNNYRMLTEKVYVDLDYDAKMKKEKRDKIFCLVYTIDKFHEKIPAIRETWGPKCDGFMVASNKTDPALGTVNILHEGPEEYNNIWQKVRSMWSYVYDNYYEKYDWFHIGGDDLYLIVENLRYYVESEEIKTAANGGIYLPTGTETKQVPLFLGRRFAYLGKMDEIFNSGGSGYTMNKAALKLLVVDGFSKYFQHLKTFSEDTMVARVFKQFDVYPYETKDKKGGERYMPFLPGHHYGYRIPENSESDWYAKYSINIKEGADHCAARSIAFHYVKDAPMMNRLHALLYHLCPEEPQ